jgi:hypothetical protein
MEETKMNIQEITNTVFKTFEMYKNEEYIEVEMRLGKHNGTLFDTNIGKESWTRILNGLRKYEAWEHTETTVSDVYYNDTNSIRITANEVSGDRKMIQKIGVVKQDFTCQPLDVRFCIAREIPTSGSYEMDRKRTKTRYSFVRKNLSIDMTVSSGDTADMDAEDNVSYQVELEIIKPGEVDSMYTLFNCINKIQDLIRLI